MNFEKVKLVIVLDKSKDGSKICDRNDKSKFLKGYKGFQTLIWEDDKFIQDGTKKAFSVDNYKKLGSLSTVSPSIRSRLKHI